MIICCSSPLVPPLRVTRMTFYSIANQVTYVRPLLEYAVHVWSPYQLEDIARIESVQRRFTKRLSGLSNDNYSSRLETLGLKSLELRRLHQDLMYTYKIIFGLVDLDCSRFLLSAQTKQLVGIFVSCLCAIVALMFGSIFFVTVS